MNTIIQDVRAIKDSVSDGNIATKSVDELTLIDEASSTVTYIGVAPTGTATSASSWKIKKLSTSGTVTTIAYADSNTNYDNVWDNRASLSYG